MFPQPVRITSAFDLFNRTAGGLIVFQFDEQGRLVRVFRCRKVHDIRITLAGVELKNRRIILLCRIIGVLDRVA